MSRFKIFIVTIHIAGWLLFMAFPLLFLNGVENSSAISVLKNYSYWLFGGTYIVLFYINAYVLIPRLFLRKKYIDYAILVFVLFSCVYVIKPYDKLVRSTEIHTNISSPEGGLGFGPPQGSMPPQSPPPDGMHKLPMDGHQGPPSSANKNAPQFNNQHQPPGDHFPGPPNRLHFDSTSLFIFLMIMAISTAIKVVQQWQLTEQRAARAETDKATAELSFLKAQTTLTFYLIPLIIFIRWLLPTMKMLRIAL